MAFRVAAMPLAPHTTAGPVTITFAAEAEAVHGCRRRAGRAVLSLRQVEFGHFPFDRIGGEILSAGT